MARSGFSAPIPPTAASSSRRGARSASSTRDGRLTFETQGTAPEEIAHLPLLEHPAPRQVLLVGGGIAGDLREILKHPVAGITYVELDPPAGPRSPGQPALRRGRVCAERTRGSRSSRPTVGCTSSSGVAAGGGAFDVAILDLPEPATGTLNRFYTAEFFAEARRVLAPGGILALRLPSAENYWSPELVRRNAATYRTLQAVFPEVLVLPGEQDLLPGFRSPARDRSCRPGRPVGRARPQHAGR